MKKLAISLISLFIFFPFQSCKESDPRKKLISDWAQTIDKGTKADLSFKLIELKDVKKITIKDSLTILDSILCIALNPNKPTLPIVEKLIPECDTIIDFNKGENPSKVEWWSLVKASSKRYIYLSSRDKNEIIGNLTQCTYSIKNPFLGINQELTKKIYFNAKNTAIINVIDL